MGSLSIGDLIATPNGFNPVRHIYPQGEKDIYLVTFSDGASTRATLDHLWKVRFTNSQHKEGVVTTGELIRHFNCEQ